MFIQIANDILDALINLKHASIHHGPTLRERISTRGRISEELETF